MSGVLWHVGHVVKSLQELEAAIALASIEAERTLEGIRSLLVSLGEEFTVDGLESRGKKREPPEANEFSKCKRQLRELDERR